jgi:penicillin amidase
MNGITPNDMMNLQNDYFNTTAEDIRPVLLKYVKENELNADEKKYLDIFKGWDLMASPDSKGQTIYQAWWDSLDKEVWRDELSRVTPVPFTPDRQTLLELLIKDSAMKFIDNINTPQKETLFDVVTASFKKACVDLKKDEADGKLEWSKFKDPTIYHLIKDLKPFARKSLHVGGNGNIINAVTHSHGPSWRMIVQLTTPVEAYAVYPGGQSGNPGSKFYDNDVDTWTNGKYNRLWYMRNGDKNDAKVKWRMKFSSESEVKSQ